VEREIKIWQGLRHKNVVRFIGYFFSDQYPSIVSLWMENGNIQTYLKSHPDVLKNPLLLGIAEGLEYLHSLSVIHGDLKTGNVLVDSRGIPQLCDFGLSRMMGQDSTVWDTTTKGTMRWMAPELLKGPGESATPKSDVYSYGMTCLEILTGQIPFFNYHDNFAVMAAVILRQELPLIPGDSEIPAQLTSLWKLCWSRLPNERPSMQAVGVVMRHICESMGILRADSEETDLANNPRAVLGGKLTYGCL
ncbi:kinase-like domain-containing protein, partial [Mycena olivaceomarginata]